MKPKPKTKRRAILGVRIVGVFRVTRRCGHEYDYPSTTTRKYLKQLVETECLDCANQ